MREKENVKKPAASGKQVRKYIREYNPASGLPGGALEEVVALAVHQLAAEPRHLVLHLLHLGVEALTYVGELGVDHAEVAELDGNVALDTTVGHGFRSCTLTLLCLSCHCDHNQRTCAARRDLANLTHDVERYTHV